MLGVVFSKLILLNDTIFRPFEIFVITAKRNACRAIVKMRLSDTSTFEVEPPDVHLPIQCQNPFSFFPILNKPLLFRIHDSKIIYQ